MAGRVQLDCQPGPRGSVPASDGPGRAWYARGGPSANGNLLLRDRDRFLLRDGLLCGACTVSRKETLSLSERGQQPWGPDQPASHVGRTGSDPGHQRSRFVVWPYQVRHRPLSCGNDSPVWAHSHRRLMRQRRYRCAPRGELWRVESRNRVAGCRSMLSLCC